MKKNKHASIKQTSSYQKPNFVLIDKRIPYLFKQFCNSSSCFLSTQQEIIDTSSLNNDFILIDNQTGEIIK